ncbi:CGNR zinc finger domain-containing protein [Streptomyces sp. NPDC091219]|uniref:CGNR zinc finger domain-containing protein n=1 Tax=Streptomyces sp. NPDC091219 TaxID=3155193 RepID=UPI00344EEE88
MQQVSGDQCSTDVCRSSDLLLGFVNTGPHGSAQVELLGDSAALHSWMVTGGLLAVEDMVTEADTVAGRELREALSVVFRDHSGCADGAILLSDAEAYLQRTAERYPLTLRITAEGCVLVPAQSGVLGGFGALFAAAADLAARGIWSRMKMCKNAFCHAGFFDKTRNSSGLYCSSACSSQAAQRAYRSRLKGEKIA